MGDERQQLIERISSLSDNDLLRMVYLDYSMYRSEAINFARFEINKRGITVKQNYIVSDPYLTAIHPSVEFIKNTYISILEFIHARAYITCFMVCSVLFVIANYYSYSHMYDNIDCDDCFVYFGFPFKWCGTGGFGGFTHIQWEKLLADVLIGSCIAMGAGLILQRFSLERTVMKDDERLWNKRR